MVCFCIWALICSLAPPDGKIKSVSDRFYFFFRFWPLVALVSTFGHSHVYIRNQLDEFYQMSTKNRDSIFEPQKREHPSHVTWLMYDSYHDSWVIWLCLLPISLQFDSRQHVDTRPLVVVLQPRICPAVIGAHAKFTISSVVSLRNVIHWTKTSTLWLIVYES